MYLYLVYNNFASLSDLSDIFNVNRKTIMRWISKLRQSGLVLIKSTNRGYIVEGYKEWDETLIGNLPVEITKYKAMKEEFYRWKEEVEHQGMGLTVDDVIRRFGVTEKTARKWLTSEKSHFATLNGSHATNVRRATLSRGLERKGREKSHPAETLDAKEKSHARKSPSGKSPIEGQVTEKSHMKATCDCNVHAANAQAPCSGRVDCEQSHVREKSHREPIYQISLYKGYITPAGAQDGTFPDQEKFARTFPVQEEIPSLQGTYRNAGAARVAKWIRANVDAVGFVQWMGVTLYRPRGNSREWAGHCPLHDDRRPSFYVNEENGFWYCHACGIGGDLVELVRRKYGLRFGEAIRWILSRLSFQPQQDKVPHQRQAAEQEPSLPDGPKTGWEVSIMGEEGKSADMETAKLNAATYLVKQRGIRPDTIEQYNLGVTESEEIAIPLMDKNGNRTGTLYRSIREENGQRYRQQGGTVLFGVPQALRRMQETGQNTLYVVEGPFDAMSIYQEGYPAVAIMASTLTWKQAREIREVFGDVRIVLIPDNDQAGWKSAEQNRKTLQKAGFAVKVSRLPHGKDANEYLAEKFRRRYISGSCINYTENKENNTA